MITLGSATKVHLLAGVTDMRRGFEGLFALARALLEADDIFLIHTAMLSCARYSAQIDI